MPSLAEVDDYPQWPNLAAMMFDRARAWPDRPMLRGHDRSGDWRSIRWGEFARLTASVARNLRQAGVAAGDRVLLVSENRPEYPIFETALMAIRAVPVPTYVTNTTADHAHILADSGARVAIVASAAIAERVVAATAALDLLVLLDDAPAPPGVRAIAWSSLVADAAQPAEPMAAEAATIPSGALACLIYTSGTGGAPKGVMLSHRAILSNCRGAFELVRPLRLRDEVYLSFLPLSHSYEHTVGQFFLLSLGSEIVYSRGVEHLAADMLAARPTIVAMVPRILEVIRSRVLAQVAREPAWRRALFDRAVAQGVANSKGSPLPLSARLVEPLLDRLVRRKVCARFGGRLRAIISGGARLDPEIGHFFRALGLTLMQGYGQTEAGPVISATAPTETAIDTVGQPLPGVEVRIAADGEILVRGDLVMEGYWARPADTADAIRDGWLHTGDVGSLDAEGRLRITDRKRDIIVLSGGENVSPARIEAMLSGTRQIAQAVVFGDGLPNLAALLVASEGVDDAAVAAGVAEVNARLAGFERVRRHRAVPAFTLENGLLTASHKVRRRHVLTSHADLVAALSKTEIPAGSRTVGEAAE